MNLRMGRGRTDATKTIAGRALSNAAKAHFDQLLKTEHMGLTVQVDEGHEAFDEKHSSLHPLFKKA
jgi:5-carboxymethyl-2-hydroxymuconate isomerase